MSTRYFGKAKEAHPNPFMGFTSFQHFSDEALYSDVVVRPENHMCETENLECWPIPDDVPQDGRAQGFYPDAKIAYFRVLWKEFEPVRGQYDYSLIQKLVDTAKEKGQTITFRLIAHSTRASDDVPDWLKQLIPCPERPAGKRVKDSPTDPLFLKLFGKAIEKLAQRFDDEPVFHTVDICLPGAWGEGHKLELYSDEDLKELIDTFLFSFRHTNLVAQIGLPWLVNYANNVRPVGWRGDGCGEPNHMLKRYPQLASQIDGEIWKTAPVSFEAYWWLSEWIRQGWDIDAIIEQTLSWHLSVFNAKSVEIPYELKDKVDYWLSRMGYHYSPVSFACPDTARAGSRIDCELVIENTGVAPLYEKLPLTLRLAGAQAFSFDTGIAPVTLLPGTSTKRFVVSLPEDMPRGSYNVLLGIPGISFASDAPAFGDFREVGRLQITD
ncbi:MAG: DUF4832 domain-containing protein [Clostridiales bacterium]|nr:DUF4832 domain-containing protein [Clostridiales bacterium]